MWYFVKDGAQQGPVSDEQLRSMARDGSLRGEDLVWQEGMPDWKPAMDVIGAELRRELPHELPTMPIQTAHVPPPPPAPAFEPEPPRMQTPPVQSPSMYTPPAPTPHMQTPPVTGGGASPYAPPTAHLGSGVGPDIPNYLVWSILVTLLCCVPGGIVAIIYSSRANSAKAMGDYEGARKAAATAKNWLIASVVGFFLVMAIYIVVMVMGGAFSALQQQ